MPNKQQPAKKHVEYEFGGPVGAFFTTVSLPFVIFLLYVLCNDQYCLPLNAFYTFDLQNGNFSFLEFLYQIEYWNLNAFLATLGWLLFQALLQIVLPGYYAKGVKLDDGSQLSYKINGFSAFIVSLVALAVAEYLNYIDLTFIYSHFAAFATSAIIISYALAFYLYFTSFIGKKLLARGGNTGNAVYDFFIGRELNPRIGSFDLKVFCELRPGLIGWVVINLAMALQQYKQYGSVGNGMILVCLFQTVYVADALWSESAILTTMDVTTDGFGFMLAFGDLAWVPFTYTTQARYLASFPVFQWDFLLIALFVAIKFLGYFTFRGANGQKDQFRSNPNHPSVKHLKTIDTQRGTKLMVSGWWGIARHINYTGDWLMAWSWCLPCGFYHIVPYFYVIYFAILLIHRDLRDDESCRRKYGKDWDRYCSIVKYKFIPYIY